jgi:histone H3/H4
MVRALLVVMTHALLLSKTVTALDVVYALKRSGRTLYGFGA